MDDWIGQMHQIVKLAAVVIFSCAGLLIPAGVFAQDSESPVVEKTASPSSDERIKELRLKAESAMAAIGEDSAIEDSVKERLRSKYDGAIEALKNAAADAAKAAEYRTSMTTAPDSTAKLRVQLKQLPSVESAGEVKASANPDDLQQELDTWRATLATLEEKLSNVATDPSLSGQRSAEISTRILEATPALEEVQKQLASSVPPEDDPASDLVAERFLLQAQELSLLSELEMLEQDQLSQSVRRSLQQVQEELLTRQIQNATETVSAYEALVTKRDTEAAQELVARAKESELAVPQDDQEAVDLAAEVKELGIQLTGVIQDQQEIAAAKADITSKLTQLTQRFESIEKQIELNPRDGQMARVLIELRTLLLTRVQEVADTW